MYKLLLTLRYLRRKLTPIFALLAVTLCTAMVIVVSSVMGGFLDLVRNAGRTLMGDVSMNAGLGGFPHYDELIEQIEQLDEAAAATPLIQAYGLLKLLDNRVKAVQVHGIRGEGQDRVTGYRKTLHWTQQRLNENPGLGYGGKDPVDAAMKLKPPWPGAENMAAIVPGLEISPYNRRAKDGTYEYRPSILGMRLILNVLPITQKGGMATLSTDVRQVLVVNEFHSGLYDVDANRVFVAFDVAQEMMLMDEAPRQARDADGDLIFNEDGKIKIAGTVPGRCTEIQIRAADGYTPDQLRQAVADLYRQFRKDYPDELPYEFDMDIYTWEQSQAQYIATIEHEKGLLTVLFGFVSIVAIVMIAVIFYMIVLEKTRDIGILRSTGASRAGVASIFLLYGGVLGAVGAAAGTGLAWLVVTFINEIHAWLGSGFGASVFVMGLAYLGAIIGAATGLFIGARFRRPFEDQVTDVLIEVVAGGLVGAIFLPFVGMPIGMAIGARLRLRGLPLVSILVGTVAGMIAGIVMLLANGAFAERLNEEVSIVIWDRSVYFFDRIPNRVDAAEVLVIVLIAIAASVLGAVVPAVKAALLDPVRTLRYE